MSYTLKYNFDSEHKYGKIHLADQIVLMDLEDLFSIINHSKTFTKYTPNKQFPYYMRNNQPVDYKDFIYTFNDTNINYVFKNGDSFDLRRSNVVFFHKYHNTIAQTYKVLSYHHGHITTNGKSAYIMKNPIWRIEENGKEYILMYCETNTICKLCPISYQKVLDFENKHIKKHSFYKHSNGYIGCCNNLYIHQIITGCYGNGRGTKNISIDHIDQDPLNNSFENLRISTRKEQEQNSKGIKEGTKKERKHNAKPLPEGITQNMMNKHVVYYQEWLDKDHTKQREFFKIEKHPNLDKIWCSSKSNKVTIQEKLAQANKVVDDLKNNIYPDNKETQLPKYISLIIVRDKPHLVFEMYHKEKRCTLKMVLPEEYDIHEQIALLKNKVREKYGCWLIGNEHIFNYKYDTEIDDKVKYINSVTFDISRNSTNVSHTLSFEEKQTEKYAILQTEKWLSVKMTEEHFNLIKQYDEERTFDNFKNYNRGEMLGGGIFLEFIDKVTYNHISLSCGS
jgi:hypothetical protein